MNYGQECADNVTSTRDAAMSAAGGGRHFFMVARMSGNTGTITFPMRAAEVLHPSIC
jgi:hypothetical protein